MYLVPKNARPPRHLRATNLEQLAKNAGAVTPTRSTTWAACSTGGGDALPFECAAEKAHPARSCGCRSATATATRARQRREQPLLVQAQRSAALRPGLNDLGIKADSNAESAEAFGQRSRSSSAPRTSTSRSATSTAAPCPRATRRPRGSTASRPSRGAWRASPWRCTSSSGRAWLRASRGP